ncbi:MULTISPECIES: SDR family NAD(P)-dependent oxidoreductase [Sphingobium]|uniref:SDR family NAD(P)-dependent oxidoreductase n=1 Tax=Sphingobium TaxID=165695 RepID=UPI00159BFBCA|nr:MULTISPECIES: glucose 1-dehydrogenase [unclassified Sphingobium]
MTDPLFRLDGKVALVTGGSRGLGREMALAFARHGADVIVASRKLEACEAVAADIRAMGMRALPVAAHVGKWNEIDGLIEAAYDHFGAIDVLVNNAGMSPAIPSAEMGEELFDKILSLNFKGPFRLASQIGHRMAKGDGGAIINISSTGSLKAVPGAVAYSGAKAALNAMSLSLAHEFAPRVRVNTIAAGPFLTDIAKAWPADRQMTANNALGRPGRPEEIVTTALYLASPCSSFTTGTLIRVDGGG